MAWLNPENKVLTNKDRRIIDDIRITIEHHSTTEWNLHFRNIKHVDEGVYTCAINTDPVQTKRVYLKVLGKQDTCSSYFKTINLRKIRRQ